MQPFCFIGMSGAGKSFWARRLVEQGFVHHDCDADIASRLGSILPVEAGELPANALGRWMGMPWTPGYAEREARYLALEAEVTREALAAASTPGKHVLDTSGSVIYAPGELLSALKGACRVIYLAVPPARRAAMLERYKKEPKPVVWNGVFMTRPGQAPENALPTCYEKLLALRHDRYLAMADVVLDASEFEARDPGVDGFLKRLSA
jgi:shikimate kinase